MGNKTVDPVTESALEVVAGDKQREENAVSVQENRENLIAKTYKMIGQIQTATLFEKLGACASLVWLKEVKETKIYKDISGMETWEKFCNHIGKSRRVVDEQLQNLDVFGEEFLGASASLDLDRNSLRRLRKSVSDGDVVVEAEFVRIGDEKIPLSEEYKDDLQAAFEQVLDAKQEIIKEKKATIRAKDKVIETKNKMIESQAVNLSKYEDDAKEKGMAPGEEALLKQIDELKTIFWGFSTHIDPEGSHFLEAKSADHEKALTDRVRSAYVGLLAHIKQYSATIHNAVVSEYGFPDEPMTAWSPGGIEAEETPAPVEEQSKMAELGELIKESNGE